MIKKIKKWFSEHFDYRIVGDYLDTSDGVHYKKTYIKKYYWKGKK